MRAQWSASDPEGLTDPQGRQTDSEVKTVKAMRDL